MSNQFRNDWILKSNRRRWARLLPHCEMLERRLAPAISVTVDGMGTMTLQGDLGNDDVELKIVASTDYQITDLNGVNLNAPGFMGNGTPVVTVPISQVGVAILFHGGSGVNRLKLDFSGGNVIPATNGITLDGNAGGTDALVLAAGSTTSVAHSFSNATDGSVTLAGSLAGTINYVGLDGSLGIVDGLGVADRTFTFNGEAATASLADAAGANLSLTSNVSAAVTFANPTSTLTVSGSASADAFTILSLDADGPFAAGLTVNGNAGDDALNLDFTTAWTLPASFQYQAGADNGTLALANGTTTSVTHEFTTGASGTTTLAGTLAGMLSYTGLSGSTAISDSLIATTRIFAYNGSAASVTLADAAGASMSLSSSVNPATTFANPTGSLTINGSASADTITIASADSDGPFNASLTVNGNAGDDTVNLNASMTLAAGCHLDVDLQNDAAPQGTDVINVGTGANLVLAGSGTIALRASKLITIASGSALKVVDGNLAIEANQQVVSTTGSFVGFSASGTTIQSSGLGAIVISASSGLNGTAGSTPGMAISGGSVVRSSGTGTITITGKALSNGSGASLCYGVDLAGSGTKVTSVAGAIAMNGTGGGGTGTSTQYGIFIENNAVVESTGALPSAATVSLIGTGGGRTQGGTPRQTLVGVRLSTSAIVRTVDGALTINATGGSGDGNGNFGLLTDAGTQINSTGAGAIQITGTGGSGAVASNQTGNNRIGASLGGPISSTGTGTVTISGFGGNGSNSVNANAASPGISLSALITSGGAVTMTGAIGILGNFQSYGIIIPDTANVGITTAAANGGAGAPITLIADSMSFGATNTTSPGINAATSTVTLRPNTNGSAIGLNSTFVTSDRYLQTFNFTNAQLNRITAGTLNIGDLNSGSITFTGNVTRFASTNMNLTTGGSIAFENFGINTAGGSASLTTGATGSITVTDTANDDVTATSLTISAGSGGVGTSANPLRTAVDNLGSTSASSDQYWLEADSLTLQTSSAGTGTVNLMGGKFSIGANQTVTAAATNVNATATLGGVGTVVGAVNVASGGTLSPGFSPGALHTQLAANTWASGGHFNWQIVNAATTGAVAGLDYDSLDAGFGALDISALSAGNKFNVNLWSLSSTGPDVNGPAANWDSSQSHVWALVSTPSAIALPAGGFNPNLFAVNVTANNGTAGFANALNSGTFAVALSGDGTDLLLTFTAAAITPTVTAVVPFVGPTSGGNVVVITGTGYQIGPTVIVTGPAGVKFGASNAASYTVNSATQITATAPAGSLTVHVVVTNTAGSSTASAANQYTYLTPAVASVVVNGAVRTLTGATWTGGVATITVASTAGLAAGSFVTSQGAGFPLDATVVNVVNATTFTLSSAPALTQSTPTTIRATGAPRASGAMLTLTGATWTNGSEVVAVDSTDGLLSGQFLSSDATGLPTNVTILSVDSPTTFTMSGPANADQFSPTTIRVANGAVAKDGFGNLADLSGQQSVVQHLLVTFNMPVRLDSDASGVSEAFHVTSLASSVTAIRVSPATADVAVTAVGLTGTGNDVDGYTQYVLNFRPGASVNDFDNGGAVGNAFTTLADGLFQLNTVGAKIHAGVSDTAASRTDTFWALYGASNAGDVFITGSPGGGDDALKVDGLALSDVYATFGSRVDLPGPPLYSLPFDADLDGDVDGIDLTRLYENFGTIWQF